jgi:hypothetical protein
MNCSVCGHDLKDESGYDVFAIEVNLLGESKEKKRAIEVYGKSKFRICYVCHLKSLGVKKG